jgi:alkanesulfonate monooxygenase SsuD/methylene tetrahydromethanopterin reductase-like flavin-dependent oxidoreductase (luciferase family)
MKIGYVLDTHYGPYAQPLPSPSVTLERLNALADEAELVDRMGFEGIYVPDRHARTECIVPSPLVFLASLLSRVKRARVGIFSLVLTAYHPMLVAEEAAMVDLLSEGRLTLSVSMGYNDAYWRQFGIDGRQRMSRFDESLEILKRAWSGEPFNYHGERFALDNVRCTPLPFQAGGPPLWIGGESPKQLSRAARLAEGWAAGISPLEDERWKRKVQRYRTEADQVGRPSHVVLMRDAFVAKDFQAAATIAGPGIVGEQLFYFQENGLKPMHAAFESEEDFTMEALRPHHVVGSPADCREQIEHFEQLGVDTLLLRFRRPLGPDQSDVNESIELFGAEVLPYV